MEIVVNTRHNIKHRRTMSHFIIEVGKITIYRGNASGLAFLASGANPDETIIAQKTAQLMLHAVPAILH